MESNDKNTREPVGHIDIRSRVIQVGRNPEPDGPENVFFYDTCYYIEATVRSGEIYTLAGVSQGEATYSSGGREKLEALADRIAHRGTIDLNYWRFLRFSYGAPGWNEQELSNELADAERTGDWGAVAHLRSRGVR